MERDNSWIFSFKSLSFRRKNARDRSSNSDNLVLRRNTASNSNDGSTTCSRTRSNFRRSFIKFQNRVKTAMSRNRTNRQTIHVSSSPLRGNSSTSNVTQRVTLQTPRKYVENIYSVEPVRDNITSNDPLEIPENIQPDVPVRIPPELPIRNVRAQNSTRNLTNEIIRVPTDEIYSLSNCYWYWGPLSRIEAEEKLRNSPDGAFLIRDSSSSSYLFSISFRSVGRTLHSRIEYSRGIYSLYDQEGYSTITELINHAIIVSSDTIYCYSKSGDNIPNYPVRLIKPISRFTSVRPLKYLCRFVIKQCTNINDLRKLPLPPLVKDYLQEDGPYF